MRKLNRRQVFGYAVVALILLGMVACWICEFFKNDAINYYRQAPYMLLIAIIIACLIGFVMWRFFLLSFKYQRLLVLWVWALANTGGTVFVGWLWANYPILIWGELFRDQGPVGLRLFGILSLLNCLWTVALLVSWWFFVRALRSPGWPKKKNEQIENNKV
jgi:hypothetical protein